jgi:hypothetical protein
MVDKPQQPKCSQVSNGRNITKQKERNGTKRNLKDRNGTKLNRKERNGTERNGTKTIRNGKEQNETERNKTKQKGTEQKVRDKIPPGAE